MNFDFEQFIAMTQLVNDPYMLKKNFIEALMYEEEERLNRALELGNLGAGKHPSPLGKKKKKKKKKKNSLKQIVLIIT